MSEDITSFETESRGEEDLGFRIPVLLRRPFETPLEYRYPVPLPPGSFVRVPLGQHQAVGCVWEPQSNVPKELAPPVAQTWPMKKLRPVARLLDFPPLPVSLRHFVDWASAYYLQPPGMMLGPVIRMVEFLEKKGKGREKSPKGWRLTKKPLPENFRLTPSRQKLLAALGWQDGTFAVSPEIFSDTALKRQSGAGTAVFKSLEKAGIIEKAPLPEDHHVLPVKAPDPFFTKVDLSLEQVEAADFLCSRVRKASFHASLLQGITGSGKTEIYFEAAAEALKAQKQVLVLLPEIALTAQWQKRVTARFGASPLLWHSELTPRARARVFEAVGKGDPCLVVGARSALFLPFENLGLIVVDEEHEATFKQEEGVIYNGRDMAILRGNLAKCPVILASATPSLETLMNAKTGRYDWQKIEKRFGGAVPPTVALVDMKAHPPEKGDFLSPVLVEAVGKTLERGEQVLLFLNRRGYAPLTLCRKCGYRFRCSDCSAWLVWHQHRQRMQCHHCDQTLPVPKACPECGSEEEMALIGPGVERIAEEAARRFPSARTLWLTSDLNLSQSVMAQKVAQIESGAVNVLIGTQLVAKGWHFPKLTLVGVVDADLGLAGGDLRAGERTMQLLSQVAGRAGRAEKAGHVLLQSYQPEHPVMQALEKGDFEQFMALEEAVRRPGFWPPFGRLAAVVVVSENPKSAEDFAWRLANSAPRGEGIALLGPAPAPLSFLRGKYRFRLLLRAKRQIALQPLLRRWLGAQETPKGVEVVVDMDPVSFL